MQNFLLHDKSSSSKLLLKSPPALPDVSKIKNRNPRVLSPLLFPKWIPSLPCILPTSMESKRDIISVSKRLCSLPISFSKAPDICTLRYSQLSSVVFQSSLRYSRDSWRFGCERRLTRSRARRIWVSTRSASRLKKLRRQSLSFL